MFKATLIAVSFCSLASVAVANAADTFSLDLQDETLATAASLVNGFCEKQVGKLDVKNPTEKLTIKLEDATCDLAVKLLKDFDEGRAQ